MTPEEARASAVEAIARYAKRRPPQVVTPMLRADTPEPRAYAPLVLVAWPCVPWDDEATRVGVQDALVRMREVFEGSPRRASVYVYAGERRSMPGPGLDLDALAGGRQEAPVNWDEEIDAPSK